MKKSFDEIVRETLAIVHAEDREALARYIDEKKEFVDMTRFPGYFGFSYEPYLYSIDGVETFYRYAELRWLVEWEEEKDRFVVAEDLYRFDEKLYVSKNDGALYYGGYSTDGIQVSKSLYDVWNRFLTKFPEARKALEKANRDDSDVEEIDVSTIAAYLPRDREENLKEVYAALRRYRGSDRDADALEFGEGRVTSENFHARSTFEVAFPFERGVYVPESEDQIPRVILQIGIETKDSDMGPADGVLYYDPTTRKVFRAELCEWGRRIVVRPERKDSFDVSLFQKISTLYELPKFGALNEEENRSKALARRALAFFSELNATSTAPLLKELGLDPESDAKPSQGVVAKILRFVRFRLFPPSVEVLSFPESAVVAETLNDFVAFLREIDAKG